MLNVMRIWHASYFLSTLPFLAHFSSDPFNYLLMNHRVDLGVLDEGDSAGMFWDSFEKPFQRIYTFLALF